jgi:hypothetical protein
MKTSNPKTTIHPKTFMREEFWDWRFGLDGELSDFNSFLAFVFLLYLKSTSF